MEIRPTEREGVYTDGPWLLTRNLVPGVSVYGESLPREAGVEYRRWDANRSKLAAYLRSGGRVWGFQEAGSVLYLGAGSGTTVSHVSDICREGTVTAIEISARAFRDLLRLAEMRTNLLPILGDATKPETYRVHMRTVDVLYQDVAQREQPQIFLKNLEFLRRGGTGYLIVKARSEDVAASPNRIYEAARREFEAAGLTVLDLRVLAPYQEDHAALVVRKP
jgi:fibrillarin-like pre-rRNA processing protein